MILLILSEILQARTEYFVRVGQCTCDSFRCDSANDYVSWGEVVWVVVVPRIVVPGPGKVYFRFLVQRKVDQWVSDAHHGRTKPIVKRQKALTLLNYAHGLEKVHGVLCLVILFTHWAKNFRLHPSPYHPERIGYTIAYNSTWWGSQCIEGKWALLQLQLVFKEGLKAFIYWEVHCVEHRRAEGRDREATVETSEALHLGNAHHTRQAIATDPSTTL